MERIRKYFRNQGFNFASEMYYTYIDTWDSWYKGKIACFHDYVIFNGQENVKKEMKRLCMAKKICEDKAGFIINDRVEINLDEKLKDIVDKELENNNFLVEGSQLLEKTYALGTGAFVQFKDHLGNVVIDYINAYNVIPLTKTNENKINKICFVSKIDKETYYISIHTHILEEGNHNFNKWLVENQKVHIDEKCEVLGEVEISEEELKSGVYTPYYSEVPLFQMIKPNIVNNVELDCKLGISCFANALDQLQAVDMVYDAYTEEIKNGKSRIFINEEMATVQFDENGNPQKYFDSRDTTFYSMKMGKDAKNNIIHDTPELRTEALSKSISDMLNMLSFKCNLGNNYYDFSNGTVEKTATEVISEDSDLYRQVKKDELIIDKALTDLVRAILYLKGLDYETEVNILFDDSIVQDDTAIKQDALLEYNSGIIDRIEYFMKVYRMTEDEARKKDAEIEARKPKEEVVIPFG